MQKSRLHRPEATQLAALTRSTGDLDESRRSLEGQSTKVLGRLQGRWIGFGRAGSLLILRRNNRLDERLLEQFVGQGFLRYAYLGKWCNAL